MQLLLLHTPQQTFHTFPSPLFLNKASVTSLGVKGEGVKKGGRKKLEK